VIRNDKEREITINEECYVGVYSVYHYSKGMHVICIKENKVSSGCKTAGVRKNQSCMTIYMCTLQPKLRPGSGKSMHC